MHKTIHSSITIALLISTTLLVSGCNTTEESINVRAVGKGFYWYFTLPGNDGLFDTEDDIVSDKEIYLPENRPINIEVTSSDYLYMFRATQLGLKEVAVPNMIFNIDFITNKVGRYELEVDPLCGFNFAHDNDIMGHVKITSDKLFNQWLASKS